MTQYNDVQIQEFKRLYAIRRRRQLLMAAPVIVVAVMLGMIDRKDGTLFGAVPGIVFVPIALGIIIGAVIFAIKNWRCPACDKYLGKSSNLSFCPKCGVPLK